MIEIKKSECKNAKKYYPHNIGKISSNQHNTNFKRNYNKIRLITSANIKNMYGN